MLTTVRDDLYILRPRKIFYKRLTIFYEPIRKRDNMNLDILQTPKELLPHRWTLLYFIVTGALESYTT